MESVSLRSHLPSLPPTVRSYANSCRFASALDRVTGIVQPEGVNMSSSTPFRTDAVTKASLNVGLIPSAGARVGGTGAASGGPQSAATAEPNSDAYLDTFQEELHKKVDAEVGLLVDGLQDCVHLAKVSESFMCIVERKLGLSMLKLKVRTGRKQGQIQG